MSTINQDLYASAFRIRQIEEAIAARYSEQKMRCPTHLSVGQELVGAAVGLITNKDDYAVSSHRGHAHYLGKGGCVNAMIAEIYGKETGCSKGRGGSMHLIDTSVGFMGTTAIVGNSIPVGVGLGLASKLDNKQQVSIVYIGEGATETGVFYESVNFASVKSLPVIFVCENNGYSVYSPLEQRQPKARKIHKVADSMGLQTAYTSDFTPLEMYQQLNDIIDLTRSSSKPSLIEIDCYRWREHCGPNYDNGLAFKDGEPYRSEAEFQTFKQKDGLMQLATFLRETEKLDDAWFNALEANVQQEIETAFSKADAASFPDASTVADYQYAVSMS